MPVLVAAVALIVIDLFIVNVAIPSMQGQLHTSAGAVEWVVAGYGLSFAVLLVTAGRLGDRYGRRPVLSTGMALFIASSTACGLAPGPAVLVAGRSVQGAGAAPVSPSALSLIGALYAGPARAKAIAMFGTSLGVAAAAGQLVGGALVQANIAGAGWRAVFLINVPVGVAARRAAPGPARSEAPGAAPRPGHTAGLLVRAGGLLPGAHPLPATRPRASCPPSWLCLTWLRP
ncbi:MAG: MFS transporter [Acidimicrobiales bacterium]